MADEEPWKMIKTDAGRVQTQMYVALQIAAALSSYANRSCLYSR
jgi:methionyl-tRNA synthetase